MTKLLLITIILLLQSFPSFGKDVDLVCKINKESFSVTKGLLFVPGHSLNYSDRRINETYYYRINFEEKKVINLDKQNKKYYKFKEYVDIYKNRRIDLNQGYKETSKSLPIYIRVHINRHTGIFWSSKKVVTKTRSDGNPYDYTILVQHGVCSKSKKLF